MFVTLTEVEEGLRTVMEALDPAVVHGSDAVVALARFSTVEKMANAGKMLMAKRVAETYAWQASGKQSPEHFLASVAGCSLSEAHRTLGTARKLDKLPETEKRARKGELSASQTDDIAGAAAADPTAEGDLLDLARTASASELREESRRRRHAAAANDEQRHARLRRARSLRTWTGEDGAANLHWNHLPEAGAEVGAILDDYIDDQFHAARRSGRREHRRAYAADAFIEALRDAAAFRRGESIHDDADGVDLETDAILDPHDRRGSGDRRADAGGDDRPSDIPEGDADAPARDDGDRRARSRQADRRTDRGAERDGTAPLPHVGAPPAGGAHHDPVRSGATDVRPTGPTGEVGTEPGRTADPRGPEGVGPPPPQPGPARSPDRRRARGRRRGTPRGPTRRRGADAKVIVRIDHAALRRGHTEAGETCEIAGIGAVPVASVRALLDDAFLAAVITDGRDVTTVAHLGRQPNAYQQTALQAQGIECSTLGCPNRDRLERDHRIPWRVTHHTALRELDWSCPHCHDRKTHHGDMLAPGTGKRRLLTRAEQVQWNLDHPDDPVDPPQTSYPNRPSAPTSPAAARSRNEASSRSPSPAPTRSATGPGRRRRATADSLPFDP